MNPCGCSSSNIDSVALFNLPDGAAGTRTVLKVMREKVREGKRDPRLRHLAQMIVARVAAKFWYAEIFAVFNFVKARVRYGLDTHQIEVVQGAAFTLAARYGDCDDICVALAVLLESLGHPCVFAALGFNEPGDYSHVVTLVSGAGETPLICLDATESHPAGWFPPNPSCVMLAPIESGQGA